MRRISRSSLVLSAAAGLALATTGAALAFTGPSSFSWKGQTWDVSANADATQDGAGNAVLTRSAAGTAELHLNRIEPTSGGASFVNENGTPWVKFSYIDDGTSYQGIDLFVEDETSAHDQRLQAGSLFNCDGLGYAKYSSQEQVVFGVGNNCGTTTSGRAAGPHTVYAGERADGTVDYNFDGVWYTTTFLKDNAGHFDFNDIHLRWRGGTIGASVTFTDFQYGSGHVGNKDACKQGGWQAGGVYANQGTCVSRFASTH